MSALILTSHVKDGLELGRQYGLPQIVLDFIPMHHGTMLATYFFEKAKEKQDTEDAMVLEAEFRYPGPRPDTKETGILMLADAVEAASRSLDKPTPRKLETLIDTIIRARVNDDQLDNCPLTFADLSKIKQTFLALLTGIYHTRIKYPDQEENPTEPAEIEAVTPS